MCCCPIFIVPFAVRDTPCCCLSSCLLLFVQLFVVVCPVFEVLLEFVNNGGNWNSAITTAIPLRKIDSSPAPNVTVFEPHCEEEMTEEKGAAADGKEGVDAEEDATEGRKKKAKKKRTYKRFLFHPYNLGSSSEEEDSEEEEKEKARDSNKEDSEDDEGKDLFASLYD